MQNRSKQPCTRLATCLAFFLATLPASALAAKADSELPLSRDALFGDDELCLALNRTMHTDQTFTFRRPLRPDDAVVAELSIEKVRGRGALDMITVLVDLTVDGETVCEARSTLMHTREDDDA